ncbi:MAG: hypothetical protein JNL01_14925 [Bdellovibrionales bacterium]|nr:hypothetical protein [Bdellovibrionales bacterium]
MMAWLFPMAAWTAFFALVYPSIQKSVRAVFLYFKPPVDPALTGVIWTLQELQETLESGVFPDESLWEEIRAFPAPWGSLCRDGLQALRSQGVSILPCIRRIRALAESFRRLGRETSSKAVPAFAQAWICVLGVPVLGFGLFQIVEGLAAFLEVWVGICALGSGLGIGAAFWIHRISDHARWGGLERPKRPGLLGVLVSGERFCAKVRAGTPADLALSDAADFLSGFDPDLARAWKRSVWDLENPDVPKRSPLIQRKLPGMLENFGQVLKKAVQVSLMDGRPCLERVEVALDALRSDLFSAIDAEVARLPHRTLLPLFLGVAPAVLGLIFSAIALTSWEAWSSI